jgi:hypothetical protein
MPPRRRLRLVRRQVEPSAVELAFGALLLLVLILGFGFLMTEFVRDIGLDLLRQYGLCRHC